MYWKSQICIGTQTRLNILQEQISRFFGLLKFCLSLFSYFSKCILQKIVDLSIKNTRIELSIDLSIDSFSVFRFQTTIMFRYLHLSPISNIVIDSCLNNLLISKFLKQANFFLQEKITEWRLRNVTKSRKKYSQTVLKMLMEIFDVPTKHSSLDSVKSRSAR